MKELLPTICLEKMMVYAGQVIYFLLSRVLSINSKHPFYTAFVTIPLSRGTYQTVPDQRATEITGVYTITGGDFASLIFFVGYAFTF